VAPSGWPDWIPGACTVAVIVGVIAVVLWQVHGPAVHQHTTTGGDTGAHFVMPAYIRDHLLTSGRLTGGTRAGTTLPDLHLLFRHPRPPRGRGELRHPYGIAFKLVTILGSLLLPVAAWACGRLFRLRSPGPAALAAATLRSCSITRSPSTGEPVLDAGRGVRVLLGRTPGPVVPWPVQPGLRTGKGRGWAAVVLALCILTHIVPSLLAWSARSCWSGSNCPAGGSAMTRAWCPRSPSIETGAVVGRLDGRLGILLSSWWLRPVLLQHAYSTQMGYENVTTFTTLLFPNADLWALGLAGFAVVVAVSPAVGSGSCSRCSAGSQH